MITSKKIAELANVSRGTVDRVLNNRGGVNEKTRERVLRIAKEYDYHPNLIGKSLVKINSDATFGFILTPDYNPFVREICDGIENAKNELKAFGVNVDIKMLKSLDIQEQCDILDDMVSRNIRGIALIPLASDIVAEKIDSVVAAGVPVITFNSMVHCKKNLCYVGQNHFNGGKCAANLMGRMIDDNKGVGVIISSKYLDCHVNRLSGFRTRLREKYPNIHIEEIVENQDRDDLAYTAAKNMMEKYPKLGGIYITGGGVSGVAKAISEMERKSTKLICHDYINNTASFFEDGILDFAIGQKPQWTGNLLLHLLFDYVQKGQLPSSSVIDIPIEIATEDVLMGEQSSYN